MVFKSEHDFLSWTSFPSSLKYSNDELKFYFPIVTPEVPVTGGRTLKVEAKFKAENNQPTAEGVGSFLWIQIYDGKTWREIRRIPRTPIGGGMLGTFDWTPQSGSFTLPAESLYVRLGLGVASGTSIKPLATLWIDDLKIYQDGVLIYSNDFSNWAPLMIIPAEIITGVAMIKFIK